MWSDTQEQPFAMGLRGTAIKRKLSEQDVGPVAVAAPPHQPSKAARADQWGVTDLPPTDLNPHHHHQQHHHHHHQNHHHHLQQQHHQQNGYSGGGQQQQQQQQRFYCFDDYRQQQQQQQQCYEQQQQQQTIRRDENGKSYLELGSWSGRSGRNVSPASRCCEARTNWCVRGPACYRQRRLAVLNISMCKLGRYRQFSDPSLHRSVLICNTLRLIEKEMEQEGYFDANANANATAASDVTTTPAPSEPQFPEVPVPYEPPRVPTPFPPPSSAASDSSSSSSSASSSSPVTSSSSSSTSSTTDDDRSINWGSVLSLSSQSDLDPLNNNDCLGGGNDESTSDLDDFLPAWKAVDRHVAEPSGHELESIMHVLVGT